MGNCCTKKSVDRNHFITSTNQIADKRPKSISKQDDQSGSSWRSSKSSFLSEIPHYPKPPSQGGAKDTINGITIQDPWRALEVMESEETRKFIKEQNEYSHSFLHSSLRKSFEKSVENIFHFARSSCPALQGDGFYYWLYNPGEADRDIMVRSRSIEKSFGKSPLDQNGPEAFFDPNTLPNTSLYGYSWSPSGRYFCAILQTSGSDWQNLQTIDTKTGDFVDEMLYKSKFTFKACWVQDLGFIYKRILNVPLDLQDEKADGQFGLFLHILNTSQEQDVNIWQGSGPEAKLLSVERPCLCSADISGRRKGRSWLFFDVYRNTNPECEAFLIELPTDMIKKPATVPEELRRSCSLKRKWIARGYGGETKYIGTLSDDHLLFFSTSDGHSTGRVVSISADAIDQTLAEGRLPFKELIPVHPEGCMLQRAGLIGDNLLILVYLRHACASITFADARTGEFLPEFNLDQSCQSDDEGNSLIPKLFSVKSISTRSDSNDFYIGVESWTEPGLIIRGSYNKISGKVHMVRVSKASKSISIYGNLTCRQVFYRSYDGIEIPMFLCHSRSLDLSRPQRTLLHAYGGFAVPMIPHFEPWFMAFVQQLNGILAVACIRGGGEYGKGWHEAAMGLNRVNAFNDFVFAARYLHDKKLSKPSLTATYGTSNGGTLIMATVNRNPELFQACMPDVGISDLIRFPLFTIGRIWQSEYGSPTDPRMTKFLHNISPLHNVNPDERRPYPALLVTTGENDTRVIPGHSLKYLAEVQSKKAQNPNPILGRIYSGAGHEDKSKSTKQRIEEAIDRLMFCSLMLRDQ